MTRLLAALVLLAVAACTSPQTTALIADSGGLPARAEIAEVPFFPQEKYYCGPAALAMALAWSGLEVTQADMVGQVYSPERKGTLRADMLAAARRNGRLAVPVSSVPDLLAEIAAGNPVIVFQNLALQWYPQWHFAVAIGYDLTRREIVLHSGTDERRVTTLDTFEHTWARGDYWALVVSAPDRLPRTPGQTPVLHAAAGLERAERYADAATAYGAILQRWPDGFAALMGLGNARYGAGDRPGAAAAFRRATERHPTAPAAWNNLAHVLAEQGQRDDALAAAREAVRLGGADTETYRATLREITGEQG